jgi:hypothetical protein
MLKRIPLVLQVLFAAALLVGFGFGVHAAIGEVWQTPKRIDRLEARVNTLEATIVGQLEEIQDTLGLLSGRTKRTECAVIAQATGRPIEECLRE